MKTIIVEPDGSVDLSPEALQESGIQPGAGVVVLAHEGRIVLLDKQRFRERVERPMQAMLAQFRDARSRNPQAPFFDSLSVEQYAALTDEAEKELRDRLTADAEKQVKGPERDIPPHFRPAGQKRR